MLVKDFEWDEGNLSHIQQHGVCDYEVEDAILFDEPVYYRGKENKYYVFGITNEGRYLFIVFAVKDKGIIRAITARNMTRAERKLYNKRK